MLLDYCRFIDAMLPALMGWVVSMPPDFLLFHAAATLLPAPARCFFSRRFRGAAAPCRSRVARL